MKMKRNILKETIKKVTRQILKEFEDKPLTDERREELRQMRERDQQEYEARYSSLEFLIDFMKEEEFPKTYYKIVYDRIKDKYERGTLDRNNQTLKKIINVWNESPLGERFKLYNRDYDMTIPDIIVIDSYIKGSPDNLPYEKRTMTNVPLKFCSRIRTMSPKEENILLTLSLMYHSQETAQTNFTEYLREKQRKKGW